MSRRSSLRLVAAFCKLLAVAVFVVLATALGGVSAFAMGRAPSHQHVTRVAVAPSQGIQRLAAHAPTIQVVESAAVTGTKTEHGQRGTARRLVATPKQPMQPMACMSEMQTMMASMHHAHHMMSMHAMMAMMAGMHLPRHPTHAQCMRAMQTMMERMHPTLTGHTLAHASMRAPRIAVVHVMRKLPCPAA